MEKNIKYAIERKNKFKKYADILLDKAYKTHSKKSKECMGIIAFYDEKIIKLVVKKNINNYFKKIIECLMKIEESDENPGSNFHLLLDEVERFKKELNNKYTDYLDKRQKEFYKKKMELIEKEIKNKIIIYQMFNMEKKRSFEEDEEIEKENHRRR